MIRQFHDNSVDPPVRGFLHIPESASGIALVLTHGAGSNAQAPLLVALAETFCAAGFTVLRCDLPYRQVRSFGPPGPGDAARDRAGLKNAVNAVKQELDAPRLAAVARRGIPDAIAPFKPGSGLSGDVQNTAVAPPLSRSLRQGGDFPKGWGSIFLAGHSYGGRQSSMLCAELAENNHAGAPLLADVARRGDFQIQRALIAGLLLLSYPLHPPRKPEQQRTQHLPNLRTPTLFVSGTRDPFGSIAELEQALKMIPAKTKLLAIEGAGHDLGFKGKAKKQELPQSIFSEFASSFG